MWHFDGVRDEATRSGDCRPRRVISLCGLWPLHLAAFPSAGLRGHASSAATAGTAEKNRQRRIVPELHLRFVVGCEPAGAPALQAAIVVLSIVLIIVAYTLLLVGAIE